MTMRIAGMGWVTPLGAGVDEVWARLMAGAVGEVKPLANAESGRTHPHRPVPPKVVEALGRAPRLRRASPLSYYGVAAGLAALAEAGLTAAELSKSQTALIFAVSSGSVLYTRKFYEQVVKQGAKAASPLLFPETVYNAPASHLAAQLGIDGATYTVVGDSSVGIEALKFAEQLLETRQAERCLVVGTEELDWVLCEGYRDWRFATSRDETSLYAAPAGGAILAEGAGALLLAAEGTGIAVRAVHEGAAYGSRAEAPAAVERVCRELLEGPVVDCVIGSANGSFCDRWEAVALARYLPETPVYCPKAALGEALGASALWQVIAAAQSLRRGELPPVQAAGRLAPPGLVSEARAGLSLHSSLVLATGLNQQAGGAVLGVV